MNRRLLTTGDDLQKAARHLAAGNLVGVPTETVYGLAADASQDTAVAKIFHTKGRPSFNPLICHVTDIEMASRLAIINPLAKKLIQCFWPGPLTLVLPKKSDAPVSGKVFAGLNTIAVRCPAGPLRELVRILDRPVAAPSANRSGKISATSYQDVVNEFPNHNFPIIDGGACEVGIESTIIKVNEVRIILLRQGKISQQDVLQATGIQWEDPSDPTRIQAPGMTKSHYAPDAKVLLNFDLESTQQWIKQFPSPQAAPRTGLLDFGGQLKDIELPNKTVSFELSETSDLSQAAKNLYLGLRSLDQAQVEVIIVARIPEEEVGAAIADRLQRAAADKESNGDSE